MNLKPIGSNKTEVTINKDGRKIQVLFSYQTPVAAIITESNGIVNHLKTNKYWSRTTSKHVSQYLNSDTFSEMPQFWFDGLVS